MLLYILQYDGVKTVKITGGGDLVFISGPSDSFQRIGTINRDGGGPAFWGSAVFHCFGGVWRFVGCRRTGVAQEPMAVGSVYGELMNDRHPTVGLRGLIGVAADPRNYFRVGSRSS